MSVSPGVNSPQQAALLIDADNFADPQAIDAAWAELQAYAGRVSVCRAYGAGPRLEWLQSVWRYLGTRTFPNLPLQKNTTDAALITDAVALHFQQGIRLFAIASGDADFAPLAVRLREWGCEVWCFSMEGIVFRDAETYYDRVRCFPAPVFAPAPTAPAPLRPVMPSARGSNADVVAAPPAHRAAAAPLSMPPVSDAGLPDEVERILNAIPGLRKSPQHLCNVVPVLQRHGFFDKNTTKSTAFLARHAAYFTLSPADQPTQLTYTPPRSGPPAPAHNAATEAVKPVQEVLDRAAAVISWPVTIRRRVAPPLLAELHGLRSVLLQLAIRRVSAADVLLAVPEVLQGQPCALSAVAGRLREKGLLRPYQSALRVLERHPASFTVKMQCTPQTVIYLR
ncbi:MAG: hypothetical protein JWP96_1200 [Polaromonas sp.]|nr:hypothetical protein [Polaromonas sp.]